MTRRISFPQDGAWLFKMSNFAVKRREHRDPPKSTGRPEDITTVQAA